MPAMIPAAVGASALGTGAAIGAGIGGAGLALGGGIAAGTALAGGTGLAGLLGGLGGAGSVAGGALGALAPGVASTIAPAAASQLAGTIGAGVAPGAFGANLAGAAAPGLAGTVGGGVAPGAFGANLAGAGQGLAGAYNPATAQTLGAEFLAKSPYPVANANNLNFLNSSVAGGNTMPLGTTTGTYVSPITNQPVVSSTPPFSAVTTPATQTTSVVPQTSSLTETIRNANTAMRGNVPISYAEGAQGIAPNAMSSPSVIQPGQNFMQNLGNFFQDPSMQAAKDYASEHPYATSAMAGLGAMGISKLLQPGKIEEPESNAMIRPYTYERTQSPEAYATSPTSDSSERNYFNDQFIAGKPYKASAKAEGGIASAYAVGGPVEQMAAMNATGANTGYPMADLQTSMYANPMMQRPEATNVIAPSADAGVGAYTGAARFYGGGLTNPNAQGRSITNWGEDGGSNSKPSKQSPGYTYLYDPNTMQFTQTSKPVLGYAAQVAPSPGTYDVGRRVKTWTSKPTNITSGGISSPAMGPMEPESFVPDINIPAYRNSERQLGLRGFYGTMDQQLDGFGGYAKGGNVGGESHLGDYSDGGRLLKGPGDGVSDSIPASIGGRQPARLADGEFVVPARIVSELGNGSTEAGARKLYAMMERIQKGRRKSVGKGKVAVNSKAEKHLPA